MHYPLFHPRSEEPPRLTLSSGEFSAAFPQETHMVEFKEGIGTRALQEAIVAFSNSHGGVVLIGINDSGTVIGRELTQSAEEAIHQAVADTRNPGRYELHRVLVGDKPVIAVGIDGRVEGFAQTANGRVLQRTGPRNTALFDADLFRFISDRALERFEMRSSGVAQTAADPAALRELASAFGWGGTDDVGDRLREQQFVTASGELTIAGALYLLEDPSDRVGKAYIEILRFADDGLDYDKRTEIRGTLPHQVSGATSAILDELGSELVVLGVERHQLPRLPSVVVREALANAVAHRSYEAHRTAVRVEIRPGRVLITSPGPLPVPVTVENIREAQAARNVIVVRALRRFGLAEDAGRGVDVMQDSMAAELLEPPSFADTGHSVEVTLPVRSTVTARERAWIREIERRGDLHPDDLVLLVHAARGEVLTNRKARDVSRLDRIEATRALGRLRAAGFLEQRGERGGASYVLSDSLNPPAGLRLSRDELKATVVRLAGDGPITNTTIRERLGLDRAEALRLLTDLVESGELRRTGSRRGTRYVRT
jgi:ATP-dependent DNA helicase RecG